MFVSSARVPLWLPILVNCLAFGHLLSLPATTSLIVGANLCMIASLGFVFNDVLDTKIDAANNIDRWSLTQPIDAWLLAFAFVATGALLLMSAIGVGRALMVSLCVVCALTLLYSVLFKKIFLVGNLLAAALCVTPGLLLLNEATSIGSSAAGSVNVAISMLSAGFLFLTSREVKFDEFDKVGDIVGQRTTLPRVFTTSTLKAFHACLNVSGALILMVSIVNLGRFAEHINLLVGAAVSTVVAGLLIDAFRSNDVDRYTLNTRIVMLLIPLTIYLCF